MIDMDIISIVLITSVLGIWLGLLIDGISKKVIDTGLEDALHTIGVVISFVSICAWLIGIGMLIGDCP